MSIQTKTSYDTDYLLWIDQTIVALKARQVDKIDWEHLIEEVESLGKSEKRELESRLTTLLEYLLKRCYTDFQQDFRGWNSAITREQRNLKKLLAESPSLKRFWQDILNQCYQEALGSLRQDLDYQRFNFPDRSPFPQDIEELLHGIFWI